MNKNKNSFTAFIYNNKTRLSYIISLTATLLFAIYNGFLGFFKKDSWGISIFVYYLCLLLARIIALKCEQNLKDKPAEDCNNIRKQTYIKLSIFIFFIDLCLIAPITLMIVAPNDVNFGIIPAITIATYTTYKVTMAIINYVKVKSHNNLLHTFLREISVIDAIVSVLTLQHTLIMVNDGMNSTMSILSCISSFVLLTVIIVFSILNFKKALNKNLQEKSVLQQTK